MSHCAAHYWRREVHIRFGGPVEDHGQHSIRLDDALRSEDEQAPQAGT
jgi:hypothetical protein